MADPPATACRSDWSKCADNEQLVNEYKDWVGVKSACKTAAEERAKYGTPKWPWFAFSSFRSGNEYVTSGNAVAIEPDAQFSNAFGAMVHARVRCAYDLRTKTVIEVQIVESR